MSDIVITLRITIPDNATVSVDSAPPPALAAPVPPSAGAAPSLTVAELFARAEGKVDKTLIYKAADSRFGAGKRVKVTDLQPWQIGQLAAEFGLA